MDASVRREPRLTRVLQVLRNAVNGVEPDKAAADLELLPSDPRALVVARARGLPRDNERGACGGGAHHRRSGGSGVALRARELRRERGVHHRAGDCERERVSRFDRNVALGEPRAREPHRVALVRVDAEGVRRAGGTDEARRRGDGRPGRVPCADLNHGRRVEPRHREPRRHAARVEQEAAEGEIEPPRRNEVAHRAPPCRDVRRVEDASTDAVLARQQVHVLAVVDADKIRARRHERGAKLLQRVHAGEALHEHLGPADRSLRVGVVDGGVERARGLVDDHEVPAELRDVVDDRAAEDASRRERDTLDHRRRDAPAGAPGVRCVAVRVKLRAVDGHERLVAVRAEGREGRTGLRAERCVARALGVRATLALHGVFEGREARGRVARLVASGLFEARDEGNIKLGTGLRHHQTSMLAMPAT